MAKKSTKITIVIPTLNRGTVLIDTINYLSELELQADSILVVDQTEKYPIDIESQLKNLDKQSIIKWIKLTQPSVVAAMNIGLKTAQSDYVLFLDDDIKPRPKLIENYQTFIDTQTITENEIGIIAGRVIQPWNSAEGPDNDQSFSFNSLKNWSAPYFIGANVLVNRNSALSLGGFDENFIGTAHDYEREFSDRVLSSNLAIAYCGQAAVDHLKEVNGGIRTYGHFLKTIKPHHAVGAYYYILRSSRVNNKTLEIFKRLRQRVVTKTHLKQPWWIPATFIGDIMGILWAIKLYFSGAKLISKDHLKANS